MRLILPLVLATTILAQAASAEVVGDAVKGKSAFGTCAICHSATADKNGIGPSLFGVVGRTAGTAPGFKYSAAMKAAGAWTPARLDAFITDPKATVPGTSMPFAGLKDAQKRADIVAYLGTLK